MTEFKIGDLVTYRDAERIPTHALVLEVLPEGETLRITRGLAHESATALQEDMVKVATPGAGIVGLHRRLAYSLNQVPKVLEEKDQEIQGYVDLVHNLEGRLADIRKWMIATHEDGTLPREGLDTFLAEFGLEPYTRRWTGTVTIIVSLTVDDAKDKDAAEQAAYDWAEDRIVGESGDNIDMPDIQRMTYNLVEDLT